MSNEELNKIYNAAKILSPAAIKLYIYILRNTNLYDFQLTSKGFREAFSVSDKTFRNAKAELIDKGFLIEEKDNFSFKG